MGPIRKKLWPPRPALAWWPINLAQTCGASQGASEPRIALQDGKKLSEKPLSPCTQGERGWGEGVSFSEYSRPSPPTPLP